MYYMSAFEGEFHIEMLTVQTLMSSCYIFRYVYKFVQLWFYCPFDKQGQRKQYITSMIICREDYTCDLKQ